eukprot:14178803-Heterocapsa_arctica.AAC.1
MFVRGPLLARSVIAANSNSTNVPPAAPCAHWALQPTTHRSASRGTKQGPARWALQHRSAGTALSAQAGQ